MTVGKGLRPGDLGRRPEDQRRRRRLTLAPGGSPARTSGSEAVPADAKASEPGTQDGVSEGEAQTAEDDDEALHTALLAGFTDQEAKAYVNDRKIDAANQVCLDGDFRENLWCSIGFPKGSRW